jgi:hypothetical protein
MIHNFKVTLERTLRGGFGKFPIKSIVIIGVQSTHALAACQEAESFIGGGKWKATHWEVHT